MAHITFLHTSDWQLGMSPRMFSHDGCDAGPRYEQARIDAVDALVTVALDTKCDFIVVAGDVFDFNTVSQRTLRRMEEALSRATMPVYLLPGNHDAWDASHPYYNGCSLEHVHMLSTTTPVEVRPGISVVGAPLLARTAATDLVGDMLDGLSPTGGVRVAVGHGQIQGYGDADKQDLIDLDRVERALSDRVIDYLALGDTHSTCSLGSSGAVWFSGSPEVTDFHDLTNDKGETDSGNVLVVTLDYPDDGSPAAPGTASVHVDTHPVGEWRFIAMGEEVQGREDVDRFLGRLRDLHNKATTVVKYWLVGSLDLTTTQYLEQSLDALRPTFGALYERTRLMDLAVVPGDDELDNLDLPRWAAPTMGELSTHAASGDTTARDAMNLLFRLSGQGVKK